MSKSSLSNPTPNMSAHDVKRRTLLKSLAISPLITCLPTFGAEPTYDVVVIGAGLAGLNTARQCTDNGLSCLVLEATSRAGGRIKSLTDIAGCPEVGGMQIGKGYGLTRYLAQDAALSLAPPTQFARGQTLGINEHLMEGKSWATSDINLLAAHEKTMSPARLLSYYLKKSEVFAANDWLQMSHLDIPLSMHLKKLGASDEAIRLIEHNFNGYSINKHSALDSLKGYYSRKGTPPGFDMVQGGNQLLPYAMADNMKGKVAYDHPVTRIDKENDKYVISCKNGAQYYAKHLVFAVPFSTLSDIELNIGLSQSKQFAISQLSYTPVTQVILNVKGDYWLDDKLPASLWSDSPIERIFALKNEKQKVSTLLCWVNGKNALALDALTSPEVAQFVLKELAKIRPSTKGKVSYLTHQSWQNSPYQKGAYAYYQAGMVSKVAPFVAKREGNVHFAGEHTQPLLPGMEAALYSGMRVADEIKTAYSI